MKKVSEPLEYEHFSLKRNYQGTFWRHLKTDLLYQIVEIAFYEFNMKLAIVYKDAAGTCWVRSANDFFDGRFILEPVNAL